MPVKIRLQRHGKKGKPFYWVVAADSRAKRDGRFLEKIGTYNPNTNPATIDLNVDAAVKWLENGAQPTDTARALLSYKGALLKKHLNVGVKKGALTQEVADKKFEAWLEEKQSKIQSKVETLSKAESETKAKALAAETAVKEKRLAVKEEVAESEEATPENSEAATVEAENTAEENKETAPEEKKEAASDTEEQAAETPAKENAEANNKDATATEDKES